MTIPLRAPGPKGKFITGCARELIEGRIDFLVSLAHQYGDLVRIPVFGKQVYLATHPDHAQEILVTNNKNFHKSPVIKMGRYVLGDGLLTSEGESHRRQRRMIQPAFHSQRINAYGETMIELATRHAASWDALGGKMIDMRQEMTRLTLAIVAKTLFGAEVKSDAEEIGEALTTMMGLMEYISQPGAVIRTKVPSPRNIRFWLARRRIDKTIYRIIGERRASGEDSGDLLSMLLKAQDEDDGGVMTNKQVRDEVSTLFLSGHETTANALTWAWYLLGQNPETEAKLHAEIEEVLGGRLPKPADIPKLEYARRVFAESLRLYPPVYVFGRTALNDFTLGKYTIPRGSVVLLCPFITHRNPEYFPDPLKFDPDRWAPETQRDRHKFAFFPFGRGPRTCIAEPFAWMEGVLLLAVLARHWAMRLEPGRPVEYDPQLTLRVKHGLMVKLTKRKPAQFAKAVDR